MTGGMLQLSGVVVDFVHRVDHLPAAGEEVETSAFLMTAGGGFNAMAAARRMGVPVTYGGMLGKGPLAEIVRDALQREGIGLASKARATIDQGSCAVIVHRDGERSFITHHGAEREIALSHLRSLAADRYSYALLTGYSLYKTRSAEAYLAWLPALDRPPLLVFDPGPIVADIPRATLERVITRCDWVSANAAEALVLTGETDMAAAAARLASGRKGALVRRGADGCWLCEHGKVTHVPGFPVEAIDTNGAGDTHDGVFIAALVRGFSAADAALIANAAAALSTTIIGPATSPAATETRRFLHAHGVKLAAPENWEGLQPGATDAQQEEDRE